MNFDLSDEQKMLAEQVSRLLAEQSPPDRLRQLIDTGAQWDEPLWRSLSEFGVLGAAIPEAFGGLGLSAIELAVMAQALGRAAVSVPFLSSIGLAAELIRLAGDDEQKAKWLPGLASGELVGTFAYSEPQGGSWQSVPTMRASGDKLNGAKSPVADLLIADIAVVTVSMDGQLGLAVVDLTDPGVSRESLMSFDPLKPQGRLVLNEVPFERLGGENASAVIDQVVNQSAVLVAFEQIGGAEACLYMARDYALERSIFGRSLASYQAIKHKLADVFVLVELARSNAFFAAWAAVSSPEELPVAAAAAHLAAGDALELAARDNLQIHGGIGYTFEADCHFHYRRERLLSLILGGPAEWRSRLIKALPERQAARQAAA